MIYKIGLLLGIALILCLFPMPYGYYIFIRFVSMVIFAVIAYDFYKTEPAILFYINYNGPTFPTLFQISFRKDGMEYYRCYYSNSIGVSLV